jgi:osmoprotectant transport system ATP-binding protein
VASFVGEDRALRRLSLRRVDELELEPADRASPGDPQLDPTTTLRNALSVMLAADRWKALVVADGKPLGSVSFEQISGLLAETGHAA